MASAHSAPFPIAVISAVSAFWDFPRITLVALPVGTSVGAFFNALHELPSGTEHRLCKFGHPVHLAFLDFYHIHGKLIFVSLAHSFDNNVLQLRYGAVETSDLAFEDGNPFLLFPLLPELRVEF